MTTAPKEVKKLVGRFHENREAYLSSEHNEMQLRREFLDPLMNDTSPIQRRKDPTDKQIDQLVYELYGLTDKEIRMVEEATK